MAPVRFLKVEGAGNDFCLLDARRRQIPVPGRASVRALLDRHRGVGGDGLLLLLPGSGGARARVRYWNADGGEAAFCGNGARCVALLLLRETPRAREVEFDFGRRRLAARRAGRGRVALRVPLPRLLPLPEAPAPAGAGGPLPASWIDTGVPHWIVPVASVAEADLAAIGPAIRSWPALGPAGTNVDLVEAREGLLLVRTWERGVEGETRACGSGLAAAGFWGWKVLGMRPPLRLRSRGGDIFRLRPDGEGRGLWLDGPARIAFAGRLPER